MPRVVLKPKKKRKNFVPPKPADFILTPVSGGQWVKKINNKLHYFGRWGKTIQGKMERLEDDGKEEALALYNAFVKRQGNVRASETPGANETPEESKSKKATMTVADLCNAFLKSKHDRIQSEELKPATWEEYKQTCLRLIAAFGRETLVDELEPIDFESLRVKLGQTLGPHTLGGQIVKIRSIFKHSRKSDLIPAEFKKPNKKTIIKAKLKGGKKLFTRNEVWEILHGRFDKNGKQVVAGAEGQLRAMILLGINCGLGNFDCSELQFENIDLVKGWLDFPRPKTLVERRCKLWKETCEAIQEAIDKRPKPLSKKDAQQVFLTKYGHRWVRDAEHWKEDENGNRVLEKVVPLNAISAEFLKVLRRLKINGRKGLGFYSLRHTFASVGLQSKDRDSVKALMGHIHVDVLSLYDETGPNDERLEAVAKHVHDWLFEGGNSQ